MVTASRSDVHGGATARSPRAASERRPGASESVDGHTGAADGNLLRSPIQGTVVRVNLKPGDRVQRGQSVCVVEAMKMENDVTAHRDGEIISVAAAPGMAVRIGDQLAEIA